MSNPYKLASTGLLFLLIQLVIVLCLLVAIAIGIATRSPLMGNPGFEAMFAVCITVAVLLQPLAFVPFTV